MLHVIANRCTHEALTPSLDMNVYKTNNGVVYQMVWLAHMTFKLQTGTVTCMSDIDMSCPNCFHNVNHCNPMFKAIPNG